MGRKDKRPRKTSIIAGFMYVLLTEYPLSSKMDCWGSTLKCELTSPKEPSSLLHLLSLPTSSSKCPLSSTRPVPSPYTTYRTACVLSMLRDPFMPRLPHCSYVCTWMALTDLQTTSDRVYLPFCNKPTVKNSQLVWHCPVLGHRHSNSGSILKLANTYFPTAQRVRDNWRRDGWEEKLASSTQFFPIRKITIYWLDHLLMSLV